MPFFPLSIIKTAYCLCFDSSDLRFCTLCTVFSEMLLMFCLVALKNLSCEMTLWNWALARRRGLFKLIWLKQGMCTQLKQPCCCTPPCTWLEIKRITIIKALALLHAFRKNTQRTLYWAKPKVLVEISEISRFCAHFWPAHGDQTDQFLQYECVCKRIQEVWLNALFFVLSLALKLAHKE